MKKQLLFLGMGMILATQGLFAQNMECGGLQAQPANNVSVQAATCTRTSPAFTNKYGRLPLYIPNAATPVKTISVALHFWQKNDGTANWQNTAAHIARLDQIISWINFNLANNATPSDPMTGVQFIADTKIRIEAQYYFYQNTTLWGSTSVPNLNAGVSAVDPNRLNSLPIHVNGGSFGPGVAGFATLPSFTLTNGGYVVTFNNEADPAGDWAWSIHLLHELCHNLDLNHTYDSDDLTISNPDFLSDVFDVNDVSCNPSPGQACYHQASFGCDTYDPANTCTNNIMGGTENSHYFSPLQLGRIHRALALKSVRKYVKNCAYNSTPWEVTSNETWDFDIKMYNPIVVKNNSILTVTCKVGMPDLSIITVEPGSQLIVDGGTLTNGCGGMWRGVMLKGNYLLSQALSNQPLIKLLNGAVLENAYNGIATYVFDSNGNVNWTTTGGIVQAYDSYFRNNRRDVEFLSYSTVSLSVFRRNVFETTQLLRDQVSYPNNQYIGPHVTILGMRGITFNDNTFQNTFNFTFNDAKRGEGIRTADATYNVQKQTYTDGNSFINLQYGISSDRPESGIAGTVNITANKFLDCMTAINISGRGAGYEIRENTITRTALPAVNTLNPTYGLYSSSALDFNFVSNNVSRVTYGAYVIASSVLNTDPACNIYANTFADNYLGVVTEDQNLKLNIKCNTFQNAAGITRSYWLNDGQVGNQGSCASAAAPAGNIFSDPTPVSGDINNLGGISTSFTYYRHVAAASPYTTADIIPVVSGGGVTVSGCAFTFNPASTCDFVLPMITNNNTSSSLSQSDEAIVAHAPNSGISSAEAQSFYSIIFAAKAEGRNIFQLTENELATMRSLAGNNTIIGADARAILSAYGDRFAMRAADVTAEMEAPAAVENAAEIKPQLFEAMPNPATNSTTIRTILPGQTGTLELFNVTGELVLTANVAEGDNVTAIGLDAISNGMYLVVLRVDGIAIATKRLVVN
jgi:hypothetical protein